MRTSFASHLIPCLTLCESPLSVAETNQPKRRTSPPHALRMFCNKKTSFPCNFELFSHLAFLISPYLIGPGDLPPAFRHLRLQDLVCHRLLHLALGRQGQGGLERSKVCDSLLFRHLVVFLLLYLLSCKAGWPFRGGSGRGSGPAPWSWNRRPLNETWNFFFPNTFFFVMSESRTRLLYLAQ